MGWLKEMLLKKYIKGLLDKLPLDGKKTILGILMLVGSVALQYVGPQHQAAELLQTAIDFLNSLGADDYRNAGLVTILVGVLHKFLKADVSGEEGKP